MNEVLSGCIFVFLAISLVSAADKPVVTIDMATAKQDPDFAIQGEYATPETAAQAKGLQIVALGRGTFRVVIYNGGLPGAGWDRKPAQVLNEEDAEFVRELIESSAVQKVKRNSPTLGAAPPRGATVLFDGTKETFERHWQAGAQISDDGLLMQGATSKETFRDFSAHFEFMTPYMPHARGQGRGNSGIYYQGRYETQILDSFGLEGDNNETGGIYEIRDPDFNMCFPPLRWQTYDVDFAAARWDPEGKKLSNARLTVRLNGIVVQQEVELPRTTRAAPVKESPEPGPLYLQNHGNPVRFRNIWVIPRDADREARRPRIPGFERFHSSAFDSSDGGLLLVGELGCINCHQSNDQLKSLVQTKQAPIMSEVGNRVRPDWMMKFIADPHTAKPGTTMPNLFAGWDKNKRNDAVLALVNFLASTGRTANRNPNLQAANQGRKHFHEIGCIACHAPIENPNVSNSTSVPLTGLQEKYTVDSLSKFLKNPHSVRPSGRMPSLNLQQKEAEEIAQYLAGGGPSNMLPNLKYQAFHGDWQELPNFDQETPIKSGTCAGFDLSLTGRSDRFGLRFEGYFLAEKAGDYKFWLGSDDGSSLTLDGKKIIDIDGVHPHSIKETTATLTQGVHQVRVDYFESGGEESLTLDVQAPGNTRQDASAILTLNEDGSPVESPKTNNDTHDQFAFRRDPALIKKGREFFISLGCANCHEMKFKGETLRSTPSVEFAKLTTGKGCLAEKIDSEGGRSTPDFELAPNQLNALTSILKRVQTKPLSSQSTIKQTMVRFNCYACHERGGTGGPEFDRNALFVTTQHEMGDEGRIPPPLNGVGDKLTDEWLKHVLANGANDRPYMLTRMPNFGDGNVGHLAHAFIEEDRLNEGELVHFDEANHRVKATGRKLVGNDALACIKCHTFGSHRATGIQAMSLTEMSKRVREDWFLRYLFDPAKYRPGTRMPTGFPNGEAVVRDIYNGRPHSQITAVWMFLKDGNKAGIPDGLIAKMVELKPLAEPIIYRNFLEGVSPRGIAVGYPEKAHLAWDANNLCLKLIWHNRFIDASKHWVGRGAGNQVPLGDHQLPLDPGIPFALLKSQQTPWPSESPRKLEGFQFRSYHLNESGQPTFEYETPFATISDFPKPVSQNSSDASFRRTLHLTAKNDVENIYFRAAVGNKIVPTGDGFRINDAMSIRIQGGSEPFIRESNGQKELLVLITFKNGQAEIIQSIQW